MYVPARTRDYKYLKEERFEASRTLSPFVTERRIPPCLSSGIRHSRLKGTAHDVFHETRVPESTRSSRATPTGRRASIQTGRRPASGEATGRSRGSGGVEVREPPSKPLATLPQRSSPWRRPGRLAVTIRAALDKFCDGGLTGLINIWIHRTSCKCTPGSMINAFAASISGNGPKNSNP